MQTTEALNVLGTCSALYRSLLEECPVYIPKHSLSKDVSTISRRASCEGLPFLTSTLPLLGKAVDRALETGVLAPVPGFSAAHKSRLPAFMQDVLRYVFLEDGMLRPVDTTNVVLIGTALRHIRTVCFFAYKLDVGYPAEVEAATEQHFIETDLSLPTAMPENDELLEVAAYEAARLLEELNPVEDFLPRHGPGAVAGREVDEEKWVFDSLPLSAVLKGFGPLFFVNQNHRLDSDVWLKDDMTMSRLAFARKDARGPRAFAIEDKTLQWLQQAIRAIIGPRLERNSNYRINFVDQGVNRRLAVRSSVTREDATLDLKDASNRIAVALAGGVLPPVWFKVVMAVRSEATVLPSGKVHQLRMLSSMGSATTFPIEALIFWCLAVAAIAGVRPGSRQWIRDHVYVYGDDLIVPREYARLVMDALERYGLLVNRDKSFIDGFFRESCGADAYHGFDVTPVRMKKCPPRRRRDGELAASCSDLAERLFNAGYPKTSDILYRDLEQLYGRLPYGVAGCGYLHRACGGDYATAFLLSRDFSRYRWNRKLQLIEMRVWAVEKRTRRTFLDGWSRLLRNLTMGCGDRPDHIAPTHGRVVLRQFWRAVTR